MVEWWNWFHKAPTVTRNGTDSSPGCCEVCGGYGVIFLNGQRFFCWDHYTDLVRRQRDAYQQQGARSD